MLKSGLEKWLRGLESREPGFIFQHPHGISHRLLLWLQAIECFRFPWVPGIYMIHRNIHSGKTFTHKLKKKLKSYSFVCFCKTFRLKREMVPII